VNSISGKVYSYIIGIIIEVKEMNEIKENKIVRKTLYCNTFTEEFNEMDKEEQDFYLFLRGGFTAK